MSENLSEKTTNLFNKFFSFIKTINSDDFDSNSVDFWIEKFKKKISNKQIISVIDGKDLWNKFLKKTLKRSLNEETDERVGQKLLQIIIELIDKLTDIKTSLETTLELICGHSMFNDILIDERFKNSSLKYQLVSILCLIYEKDLNLINNSNNSQMISIILSAYNLSLTKTDQKLLQLLSFLEEKGLNLYRYQPFLWGINGAIHYSVKNKQKETLLKDPKMEQILSSIDANLLRNTLNHFPIGLPLNPIQIIDVKNGHELTDPRFLLPLFYQLLSNQSLVKCHKFVSFGCLSYIIGCLSSLCPDMRRLAYCVLSRFYIHLEMATFPKDRFLWIAIIDCIRSGVTEDNIRIKSLISVFMIRIIDVLLHPNDKLYESVRKYLINNPNIHFHVFPDFYANLYSSDNETHKRLQRFVISWICDGLRTEEDVKLCLKRNVLSELMSLFDSGLSDEQNRVLILISLQRMSGQYIGAKVLSTETGLFCWLKQTIFNFQNEPNSLIIVEEVFRIVETLYRTLDRQHSEQLKQLFPIFCYELIDILEVIIELKAENHWILLYSEICDKFRIKPNNCFIFYSDFFINWLKT